MLKFNPLNIISYLRTFVILSFVFLASCEHSENITFETIAKLPTDSAIAEIEKEHDEVRWAYFCTQYLSNLAAKTEKDSLLAPMLNYLRQRSIKENSACGFNAYYRFKSYKFITKGQLDSSLKYAYSAMSTLDKHDSIDPLHTYHIIGMVYFYKDEKSDSAKYYWSKGYQLAEIAKDKHMIMLFGTNLGTYYYNNGNYRNARNLFMRAKKACFDMKRDNGILLNNIVSTFVDEGDFEEADKFWQQNEKILTADLKVYRGQLYLINRINLLQMLNRHREAEDKLKMLSVDSVNPGLFIHYARVYLDNKINKNDFTFANDSFWRNTFISNIPYLASNLQRELIPNVKRPELTFVFNKIIQLVKDSAKFQSLSIKHQASLCELVANHLIDKDVLASSKYFKKALKLTLNARIEENKTQQKVIDELNQLEETFQEIKNREDIIEENKKTQHALIVALILISIILILGIGTTRSYLKLKNIEKAKLESEQESLIREQALNNRIVEYSKSIIERNSRLRNEISSVISTAPNSLKTSINQVLKDFQINSINPEENPTIAKQLLKENDNWNDQYPGFDKLNKTEQRVFVLTMESYRPKDVATVLGVSTQYVRNVKSRLKSKLNLDQNWGA